MQQLAAREPQRRTLPLAHLSVGVRKLDDAVEREALVVAQVKALPWFWPFAYIAFPKPFS